MPEYLPMWTVYNSPADHPGMYVARKFLTGTDGPGPTDEIIMAYFLDDIRDTLQTAHGMGVCLPRFPEDDPHIVEVWL